MLSDLYPPAFGGMERHVSLLSNELSRRGHEITVCTTSSSYSPVCSMDGKVRVFRVQGFFQRLPFLYKDQNRRYPPPVRDPVVSRTLESIIRKVRPDIVHSHGWILNSFLSLKKRFELPLVVTLHGYDLICPKKTLLTSFRKTCDKPFTFGCVSCSKESFGFTKAFSTYLALRKYEEKTKVVDHYLAVSSFVKEAHVKHLGLNVKDVTVVPNFYEPTENEVGKERHDILPDQFILFVGALSAHKGIDVLVDAFKKLRSKTKLVIIGSRHPSYSYHSDNDITVIENASNALVNDAYSKCSFVVVPSIFPDPCPTVAFEAMSNKKAIIGTNIGGLSDIVVTGKTGLLVAPNDSRELSNAMEFLLSNPEKTEQFGLNGYNRYVTCFTPSAVVPQIEKIYQSIRA